MAFSWTAREKSVKHFDLSWGLNNARRIETYFYKLNNLYFASCNKYTEYIHMPDYNLISKLKASYTITRVSVKMVKFHVCQYFQLKQQNVWVLNCTKTQYDSLDCSNDSYEYNDGHKACSNCCPSDGSSGQTYDTVNKACVNYNMITSVYKSRNLRWMACIFWQLSMVFFNWLTWIRSCDTR